MVKLSIDGKDVEVRKGTTILEAAKKAGIRIPTLCYLKDINEIGACRLCLCEIEGVSRLQASCNTLCEEGMVVKTRSPRVPGNSHPVMPGCFRVPGRRALR